jgi:hypothetical protein
MTDRPTGGSTGGEPLTPEQEDDVARLLADAAGPVRMPQDVAARLDDVLADLVAQRSDNAADDELTRARARRRWPRVLLAAAAVVVGGYAVGTAATDGMLGGSADSESSSGAASDSSMVQEDSLRAIEPNQKGADQDGGATSGDVESAPKANEDSSGMAFVAEVRLRPDKLERDVRRALRLVDSLPAASLSRQGIADSSCPGPPLGKRERSLPVRYDGEPAVLVTGPERRGAVEATVHSCEGEVLDRTRVRR